MAAYWGRKGNPFSQFDDVDEQRDGEVPSAFTSEMYGVYLGQLRLDVSILNMHDTTRDLLEAFLCTSLVGADRTCQEYRKRKTRDDGDNNGQKK